MSRGDALLVVALLLLAFALRVYRLDAQSLWYDEAVTAHVTGQRLAELTRWTADDIQPPLYYYIVAGWTRLAGRGEWALRFPSAFFGTLTAALLWSAARRLFPGQRAAARAGLLLFALSPLHVYFAQEARMYTLLTFLGLLAGYALLAATRSERAARFRWSSAARWWGVFVAAAVATLYTHYFGVMVLAAYGLCWALAWVRQASRRASWPQAWRQAMIAVVGAAAIVALYLPWLPVMLSRYRIDRSYWQGDLKPGEALRHVAISFTTGAPETMLEPDAVRLLPWFGAAFGLAFVALLARRTARDESPQVPGTSEVPGTWGTMTALVLLVILLLPVAVVLGLASRTPKFNARYLMLVSPAYLLILAGGIGALAAPAARSRERPRRFLLSTSRRAAALALTVFLCAIAGRGVHNWFTDWAFTKDQWRELATTVAAQIAPAEAVILLSGHAWPAWNYYAPDIPAVRLPELDILDVGAVLGFDAAATLSRGLAGRQAVWLVSWQSETVDPVGFTPYFLDRAGTEQRGMRQFWGVGLRYWRLQGAASFPAAPQPDHPDAANFAHQVALLGWDAPRAGEITVYWRALNTMMRDYQASVVLTDAAGRELGRWDGRPAGYDYPTMRWRPGAAVFGRYRLPLPADATTAEYYISLAVYDAVDPAGLDVMDVADNPAGKRVRLGPVRPQARR